MNRKLHCIRAGTPSEYPSMQTPVLPLAVWLSMAIVMLSLWSRQRQTQNAGWVDVAWALGVGSAGVLFAITQGGWVPRRWLVGALIAFWSVRLGSHLWKRVSEESEDGRYAYIRRQQGDQAQRWLFWFFQVQAFLVVLLAMPVWVLARSPLEGWRLWDGLALVLFVTSLVGETIADRQLRAFKADPGSRGKTCRRGLWRYSRHPNYFFEWIHWWVYPVMAIGMPGGAWLWLAPITMGLLIRFVTGIPPTEAQSLRSRGDDYREYQRTTNAFLPGPTRTA